MPVHRAIYELQKADNVAGFTKSTVMGTYRRLSRQLQNSPAAASYAEEKPLAATEKFPEGAIMQELKGERIDYDKIKSTLAEHDRRMWRHNREGQQDEYENERQVIEFANNMFISWDSDGRGRFSVDRVVEELVSLGLALDGRIITAVNSPNDQ